MLAVQKIEREVLALPKKDYFEFKEWFDRIDSKKWDEEINEDIVSGSLDLLGQEALISFNSDLCDEI